MRAVFAFLAMMGLSATTALAQDCKPLELLNKIQMVPDPKGGWRIPVSVNGQEKFMALGLVATNSSVTRKAIAELGMPTRKGNLFLTDMDGNTSNDVARAREFKFGFVQANDRWFMVAPGPNTGDDERIGTLSRDLLFGYDVDIDFGTGILSLFAPDHCPDRVGYWVEPPPSTEITIKDFMVSFPVKIEDKTFTAILSLGDYSVLTQEVAKREFDIEPNPAELVPVPDSISASVPPLMGYYHTFSSLSFGGVTVKNLRVLVVQDALSKGGDKTRYTSRLAPLNSGPKISHLVLGMNVLKYLHINIAPRTGKLYISAASPPSPSK